MITKKDYNNKTAIIEDKDRFIELAQEKGFSLSDVIDYMDYYENLKSFKVNLKQLKRFIK